MRPWIRIRHCLCSPQTPLAGDKMFRETTDNIIQVSDLLIKNFQGNFINVNLCIGLVVRYGEIDDIFPLKTEEIHLPYKTTQWPPLHYFFYVTFRSWKWLTINVDEFFLMNMHNAIPKQTKLSELVMKRDIHVTSHWSWKSVASAEGKTPVFHT